MEPTYKVWRDMGGNVGIQCLACGKAFWHGTESVVDPATGLPCTICQYIKDQNVLQQEGGSEVSELPCSQPPQLDESGQPMV